MKKIIIIGSGGAGKSTLARQMGQILKIEVFHLDKLYWQPDWVKPDKQEWSEKIEQIVRKDAWIMDGNFGGTMEMRLSACDTAIFLDLPRLICLYRVLKRRLKYRNTNRPDMSEGCHEKIDQEFLSWVWNFRKTEKPKLEKTLKQLESEKDIIILTSPAEVKNFLNELQSQTQ